MLAVGFYAFFQPDAFLADTSDTIHGKPTQLLHSLRYVTLDSCSDFKLSGNLSVRCSLFADLWAGQYDEPIPRSSVHDCSGFSAGPSQGFEGFGAAQAYCCGCLLGGWGGREEGGDLGRVVGSGERYCGHVRLSLYGLGTWELGIGGRTIVKSTVCFVSWGKFEGMDHGTFMD